MTEYMTKLNAQQLLDNLNLDSGALAPHILHLHGEQELPLYLRVLIGVGAFIASLCFIGFLHEIGLIDWRSAGGRIFWGLIFVSAAIFLARVPQAKDHLLRHSFLIQSSFCAMGVGKLLFVFGLAEIFKPHEGWGIMLATLLITAATYPVYRMSVDRFLSSLAVLSSLLFNILFDHDLGNAMPLLFDLYMAVLIGVTGWLFTAPGLPRSVKSLAYAGAATLCLATLWVTIQGKDLLWMRLPAVDPVVLSLMFAAALMVLIGWVAGGMHHLTREPLALTALAVLALGVYSSPGILLAIGLMVLGYALHEKLLLLLGGLLMPAFLWLFYYSLQTDLMMKSLILIGSGLILLTGRLYLHIRKLDGRV